MSRQIINDYAYGKLYELIFNLFVGLAPARDKLSENLHLIAFIFPSDFRLEKHRTLWANIRNRLLGKTKNIGLERDPIERLTVQNKTLTYVLKSIFEIYEEIENEP
jgi:hypothetical protein